MNTEIYKGFLLIKDAKGPSFVYVRNLAGHQILYNWYFVQAFNFRYFHAPMIAPNNILQINIYKVMNI